MITPISTILSRTSSNGMGNGYIPKPFNAPITDYGAANPGTRGYNPLYPRY
jgi:hypothetical protein